MAVLVTGGAVIYYYTKNKPAGEVSIEVLDASIEAGLAEARKDGALHADEIRRRAEGEEQAILTRYRGEAATVLERERALTESQVSSARAPLESETVRLAESVVRRVLGRAA